MITKVTSANYDAYTLLFNQADAALKEYNGEPTSEFIQVKWDADPAPTFNSEIQYFDSGYSPLQNFTATDFAAAATAETEIYILNEQIIYDLDTYFGRLKLLSEIDYSFLKLPLDEPTFDIVDDATNGRRVIQVPKDFSSNGISVQGDETAEILFFSIDRYYDSTDLWTADMHYVIQWEAANKKGVTKAFLNKDSRPFIDKDGKLFFGWPISSEITDEAGDVRFSVRIYKFSDTVDEETGKPKLAFGLNTQAAKVTVNASLAFEFEDEEHFVGAETISKTSDLVGRIINSTVLSESEQEAAPTPTIISNILTDEDLETSISSKTISKDIYILATDIFDEEEDYYNAEHELVSGLNENIYRTGIYYIKRTANQVFYEFDAEDVIDKIQQIQATVPSGIIIYTAHSQAAPEIDGIGGSYEFVTGNDIVYIPVTSETKQTNHKYYAFDEATHKYSVAYPVTVDGEEWDILDRNMAVAGTPCKYFERISPKLVISDASPVGCYWITANNNESKKALSSTDSYRIWIPGPVDLEDDNVTQSLNINENGQARILIDNTNKATLAIETLAESNNIVKYNWSGDLTDNVDSQILTYTDEELPLVDESYEVDCYTSRNKKDSTVKIKRKFRVTAPAQKFVFDTVADTPDETAHPTDNVKVLIRTYNEDNAYAYQIDFSDNLIDGELDKVSDQIAYRFRQRVGQDVGAANIFLNDTAPNNWSEGSHFKLGTYDELKDMIFTIPMDNEYFYVELINIVNEDFNLDELNAATEETPLGTSWTAWDTRVARTPYVLVRA